MTVTNDGATILKSLHIDNAAAKVLVGILINFLLRIKLISMVCLPHVAVIYVSQGNFTFHAIWDFLVI